MLSRNLAIILIFTSVAVAHQYLESNIFKFPNEEDCEAWRNKSKALKVESEQVVEAEPVQPEQTEQEEYDSEFLDYNETEPRYLTGPVVIYYCEYTINEDGSRDCETRTMVWDPCAASGVVEKHHEEVKETANAMTGPSEKLEDILTPIDVILPMLSMIGMGMGITFTKSL